jgi:hypothetical protein
LLRGVWQYLRFEKIPRQKEEVGPWLRLIVV